MPKYFDRQFWIVATLFGVPMALISAGLSELFINNNVPFWFDFLTGAILTGLSFSFIIAYLGRYLFKKVTIEIPEGEKQALETGASLIHKKIAAGGKMAITDQSIIFKSHKLNRSSPLVIIPLSSITDIKLKDKLFGLFQNNLFIDTNSRNYKFVVQNREAVVSILKSNNLA